MSARGDFVLKPPPTIWVKCFNCTALQVYWLWVNSSVVDSCFLPVLSSVSTSQYQPFQLNKRLYRCSSNQSEQVPRSFCYIKAHLVVPLLAHHSPLKGGGERSLWLQQSSLWVVTQADRGSTPDLLMRMFLSPLSVGQHRGFSVQA